jgi:hypothetical protein
MMALPNELDLIKKASQKGVLSLLTHKSNSPLCANVRGKRRTISKKNGSNLLSTIRMPGGLYSKLFYIEND